MSKRKWLSDNAKLMNEWDYEKNVDITPYSLSAGSGHLVWWKCNKGHSWKTSINHRSRGTDCPYCSGRKVLQGYNDLKTLNPKLSDEWNYQRNGVLTPSDVRTGSSKKVWWKCKHSHEWLASISSRHRGNHGCPYCAGQRAITGKNDIVTINPTAAMEWDYEKNNGVLPENVCYSSNRKYWWKCNEGHSWETTAGSRMNSGCPYCAGKKVITGYNDLQTKAPYLAKQWDFERNNLTPDKVMPCSYKHAWWICKDGHSWKAKISNRYSLERGCPYCSGHLIQRGINDLETLNPLLAKQWNYARNYPLKPNQVAANSGKKVWWVCKNKHSWQSCIQDRNSGLGCPYCAGQRLIKGENDLQTKFPALATQWDNSKNNLKASEVHAFSNKYAWWICEKGHSWKAEISNRSFLNRGCPYCSGYRTLVGENDLATLFPKLAKQWDYENNGTLSPETTAAKSKIKVAWICSEGHRWKATVASRSANGNGCPYCSGRVIYTPHLIK
jgi:DNA-directed RNA polymerase subunit RPC12/RpoP